VFFFFCVYGSLYAEFFHFTGLVGLSVSLNGGVCKPQTAGRRMPAVNSGQQPT
jgi:hypothetical protein